MESLRLLAAVAIAVIAVTGIFYILTIACWMWAKHPFPNSDVVGMGIVVLLSILITFLWDMLPAKGGNRGKE